MKTLDDPTITDEEKKAIILDAARCANFMQKFKVMLWTRAKVFWTKSKKEYYVLPDEKTLDTIAMELYRYLTPKKE